MTEQDLALIRVLYFGSFIGLFALFLQWETGAARLPFAEYVARRRHVLRNLSMLFLVVLIADVVVGEVVLNAYGFLYQPPLIWLNGMALPLPAQILIGLLASDLLEFAMHFASHRIGWMWRLHRVHHTDSHLDVTTAGRAHPVEVSLYVAGKVGLYALLGLPLWIEGLRSILHNALLCVQHANVVFPPAIERIRWLLVTPAMHRLHHHPRRPFIDSNYGFIFSFWDRLFMTYRPPESVGTQEYGLDGCHGEEWQTVSGMLRSPFEMPTAVGLSGSRADR